MTAPRGRPGPNPVTRPRRRLVAVASLLALLAATAPVAAAPVSAVTPIDVDGRPARPLAEPAVTPPLWTSLQRRLDRLRIREEIPGVSVAILFPDGSTWLGASGTADVARGTAVTTDTAFALASVSKTFTGALIMALRDEGKIDLERPVVQYLPGLRIDKRITVRQLLDHTSGLRDFFLDARIDKALLADRAATWTFARSLKYVGKPYFKPGKGWHYSNTNYLILGALAERVGRAPLADQLQRRFFGPLGLGHTFDQIGETAAGPVAHGYRFAPDRPGPIDLSDGTAMTPFTSVITAAGGAGSLASTPNDLVHWARALYNGAVVSPGSVQLMLDDVARTAKFHTPIPYGLGVQAVDFDGHLAYGHSGRLLGFRSLVRWLPEERIGIAVLTNQSRTDPAIIARSLLRLALDPPLQNDCSTWCPYR